MKSSTIIFSLVFFSLLACRSRGLRPNPEGNSRSASLKIVALEKKQEIGSGNEAKVYAAILTAENQDKQGQVEKIPVIIKPAPSAAASNLGMGEKSAYEKVKRELVPYPEGIVYYYGSDSVDGVEYLILEKMEKDFQKIYDEKAWGSHWSSSSANDLIEALRALHKIGLSHKDIKPDNIMYSSGKMRFIDFAGTFNSFYSFSRGSDGSNDLKDVRALGVFLLLMKNNLHVSFFKAGAPVYPEWSNSGVNYEGTKKFLEDLKKLQNLQTMPSHKDFHLANMVLESVVGRAQCFLKLMENKDEKDGLQSEFRQLEEMDGQTYDGGESQRNHFYNYFVRSTDSHCSFLTDEEDRKKVASLLYKGGAPNTSFLGEKFFNIMGKLALRVLENGEGKDLSKYNRDLVVGKVFLDKGLKSWDEWDVDEKKYLKMILEGQLP